MVVVLRRTPADATATEAAGASAATTPRTAITACTAPVQSNRSLYVKNVFVRGCDSNVAGRPSTELHGNGFWTQINEISFGQPIPNPGATVCNPMQMPVYVDGRPLAQPQLINISSAAVSAPPTDLT
jgi:hypothetical protein